MNLKDWLRIGRIQTYPADWLLVIVPFLHGYSNLFQALILTIFMWFVHFASFAENSLFDFTQGYDKVDPSKKDHPLVSGRISAHSAVNVILWSKAALMVIGSVITVLWSPSPLLSMFLLFMWYTWGTAYNLGLSKESLLGFLPISVCFTSMGGWAWLLSHSALGSLGVTYMVYVFFTILFQISWSGHLKEMGQRERSNILVKMGARLHNGYFHPGKARLYGLGVKLVNITIAYKLFSFDIPRFIWFIYMGSQVMFVAYDLTKHRAFNRNKELFKMSLMEILTIFLPIPLLLGWITSTILMASGIIYFFTVNLCLWGKPYPRV